MVYTGYYKKRDGLNLAINIHPYLATMCEKDMILWGKENYHLLHNCFVNHVFLLDKIPAYCIAVMLKNGAEHILSTHPRHATWSNEFSSGEFYSHLSLEKWE